MLEKILLDVNIMIPISLIIGFLAGYYSRQQVTNFIKNKKK
jgi:uncharacterized protein YneF (UPF0154 family)